MENIYIIHNGEIYHHGVKGQKWGVRRYQNKDGSLTPAGRKRLSKDDIAKTKKVVDSSADLAQKLKSANDSAPKSKKQKLDLSNMSDQEMRSKINRALLEKQYNDMFAPEKVNRGRDYVGKTLEVIGTVLTIGSSALGVALAIKELKKGL